MRTILLTGLILSASSFAAQAADAKAGQVVYDRHCKGCHGPNGAAPANVTKLENGRLPDLRGSRVQSLSDTELATIVTHGKGKMRGDTTVTGKDLDDLVAFIRELKA
jgi:mono/diheme cytochrome c family protein